VGQNLIAAHDKLIAIEGGVIFNVFQKTQPITPTESHNPQALYPRNIKITPLPFKTSDYMEHCAGHLPMKQGIPQPTLKCAPSFFPHVAPSDSKD
jgi:hypothetical protein